MLYGSATGGNTCRAELAMLYKEESLSGLSIVVVRNLAKVQVSVRFR
jgi:hypothetical protein